MTVRLIRFTSLLETSVQVANLVSLPDLNGFERARVEYRQQVHAYGEDDRRFTRHSSRSRQRDVYSSIVASSEYQSDLTSAIF